MSCCKEIEETEGKNRIANMGNPVLSIGLAVAQHTKGKREYYAISLGTFCVFAKYSFIVPTLSILHSLLVFRKMFIS